MAGFEYLPDQNDEWKDGYFPITISNAYERRVSAAIGYLDPTTRQRSNLSIATDTQVSELMFEDKLCVGVIAHTNGARREFRAREVILSCGAIHSPAHLLRAGIGPVGHLKDLGIPVRTPLAGVGQGLMDHPSISVSRTSGRTRALTRSPVGISTSVYAPHLGCLACAMAICSSSQLLNPPGTQWASASPLS
jgi:5-(hydroxymethyl)furfural/furfural oxidase